MRLALVTAAMIAATLPAIAGPTVERVDILDAGTYTTETGAATADPDAPMGETVAVTTATLVEAGTTIAAAPGTDFGFRYVAVGAAHGATVPLDFVVAIPEPGLADPEADAPIHEVRFTRDKTVGKPEYLGYFIEAPWESVPGTWRFEIWSEGRQLATQTFTLTAPE